MCVPGARKQCGEHSRVAAFSAPGLAQDARSLLPFIRLRPPSHGLSAGRSTSPIRCPRIFPFLGRIWNCDGEEFDFNKDGS